LKQIVIITPVPEIIDSILTNTILRQAVEREIVEFRIINLRDFSSGNYRQIDDAPYGGGSGMVMMAGPLLKATDFALEQLGNDENIRVIYPTPQGVKWTQKEALENSEVDKLIFINGHYKGIDERVNELVITHEYSIGDYVVTCGELPAMVMVDSVVRLIPGVLNSYESVLTDSMTSSLLDAPYYTRPREIRGKKVPEVLFGGNHSEIQNWRKKKRQERTKLRRPDLWTKYVKENDLDVMED
jgi:tRNA (guanine37-N1)-methyltransferase